MRASNTVVFCAVDDLIPLPGKPLSGFPEFLEALSQAGIPCVWTSARSRHQLDPALRKFGRAEPFIAEGGACAYLAEDYFHLRPAHTTRLGRFIAIPVARPSPAAAEALDQVSEQSGVEVVSLRALKPRELVQNTGLPRNEAEAIRQRDFDELFFFAGTSEQGIEKFRQKAAHLKFAVRPRQNSLWSIAVNPSLASCVRELRSLYDRTFHRSAFAVALASWTEFAELSPSCDQAILLADRSPAAGEATKSRSAPRSVPLFREDSWAEAFEVIEKRLF